MASSVDSSEEAADVKRASSADAGWALGLSTAVCWVLLPALSTLLRSGAEAAQRDLSEPVTVALGLLPLLLLALPAIPLGAWLGRERLATRAALLALLAGIPLLATDGWWRVACAVVGFGGASFFIVAVVGLVNRRAIAAGLIGAFVLHELVAHVGPTMQDAPSLGGAVAGALIAAAGGGCLYRWRGAPEERGRSFERRAGGLRLRGAIAFGALLFFELSFGLAARPALGPLAAAASIALAAGAWLIVVREVDVRRHRLLAVVLAATVTLGALAATFLADPAAVIAAVALGHGAALLLFARALAPVSGRRSGGNLAVGLLLLAVLSLGHASGIGFLPAQRPLVLHAGTFAVLAGLLLVLTMYLTPRPKRTPAVLGDRAALGIALLLPLLAAILAAV